MLADEIEGQVFDVVSDWGIYFRLNILFRSLYGIDFY